jgi:hypothetical protein
MVIILAEQFLSLVLRLHQSARRQKDADIPESPRIKQHQTAIDRWKPSPNLEFHFVK